MRKIYQYIISNPIGFLGIGCFCLILEIAFLCPYLMSTPNTINAIICFAILGITAITIATSIFGLCKDEIKKFFEK